MNCPYCGTKMQGGCIKCGRYAPIWYGDGDRVNPHERVVNGTGTLRATRDGMWGTTTPAAYCHACKIMIIQTEIST